MPRLGQGTWNMGDQAARRKEEIAALREGIALGLTLIDTAEMYGDGRAESLAAEAIAGQREKVFLVSKVLPSNASRKGVVHSCEASLRRLKTDRVELYLLHWSGSYPLEETVRGFEDLRASGKIRAWGVSNLDLREMKRLAALPDGKACATNQVLYNLTRRGIEFDLLPWCHERGMPIMAYTPIEQGRLLGHKVLRAVAQRLVATPAQVALAWVLRQDGVVTIPKAASVAHVRENRKALDLVLDAGALRALDAAFPPPNHARPLEML
ncbi:MAG: aldo/keto reductase [Betaproteobacteria bacterium]|nr:aldo/keto reductase [Betaproteobacteria bacterium]MDH5222639.1 aldo/keto reductase [Betaproteobacteria bacterium]MDH5350380.1 aldo/keto reductase [Betaproteobacteria bacterium]